MQFSVRCSRCHQCPRSFSVTLFVFPLPGVGFIFSGFSPAELQQLPELCVSAHNGRKKATGSSDCQCRQASLGLCMASNRNPVQISFGEKGMYWEHRWLGWGGHWTSHRKRGGAQAKFSSVLRDRRCPLTPELLIRYHYVMFAGLDVFNKACIVSTLAPPSPRALFGVRHESRAGQDLVGERQDRHPVLRAAPTPAPHL